MSVQNYSHRNKIMKKRGSIFLKVKKKIVIIIKKKYYVLDLCLATIQKIHARGWYDL